MKNKYIFINFAIIFFLISQLSAKKISSIEFVGLINVKLKEVTSKIQTKKGDLFNQKNISDDVQKLSETGYFDLVEVNFDENTKKLTFKVQEKPFIKKIELRGNKKVSTGKIKEEISLKEKEYFDELKVAESKSKILDLYDEKGYIDTVVNIEKVVDSNNKVHVIILVTEGKKVVIERIEIKGNQKYSQGKILRLMELKRKKVFRENKLKTDIEKISDYYKNRGFYDVWISTPEIISDDIKQTVVIKITIFEGPVYRINNISFDGNTVYADRELLKVISIKKKNIFNQENLKLSLQGIYELYGDKGYLALKVEPDIIKNKDYGLMDIRFVIEENAKVYVDRIYISGLVTTRDEVIRRELLLKEGDVFSNSKLRRSLEKIYNLGFLDDVKVDLQPGGLSDTVDLELNIVEGRPGMLSAGAGYSSVDHLVGNLQVTHLNLFGRAQRLNLMWEFGARRQNYEISWTEPWWLKKPLSLTISLFDTVRQREYASTWNAYKEQRQGLGLSLGPRISEYVSLLFSYSYENVRIYDSFNTNIIPEGKKITSSFTSQIIRDTRDNIFDASRGMRSSLSLQLAGWSVLSGDVKFYKPIIRSSVFIPTFWKFVLSFNGTLGYIEGIEGFNLDDVKYEKFYVGGAETVRGYKYRELCPNEGGRVMFVFNTEYKFPIVQENRRTILQGALFYDLGGAWNEFSNIDFNVGETVLWNNGIWDNKLKHSIGFGIRFTTPVFPIRLDWSWPLNPRPGSDTMQFWFTIGQMF
ncbi:MAG: outer membrane protein assembly factor BamA [Endomicrobiia bacterium]